MTTPTFIGKASYFFLFIAFFLLALAVNTTWAKEPGAKRPRHFYRVTFDVEGEKFRATITAKDAIADVKYILAGNTPRKFPIGIVRRGQDNNRPWSWHLRPETVHFTEMAAEICDALPSYIEQNLNQWIEDVEYYCPWGAIIVSALECYNNRCHQQRPR